MWRCVVFAAALSLVGCADKDKADYNLWWSTCMTPESRAQAAALAEKLLVAGGLRALSGADQDLEDIVAAAGEQARATACSPAAATMSARELGATSSRRDKRDA